MKIILTALLIMVACASYCQTPTATLSGKIVDSASNEPLDMATVAVYTTGDTVRIADCTSRANGGFKLPGIPLNKRVRIVISFSGYPIFTKEIVPDHEQQNLGIIKMTPAIKTLEELVVHAEKPPISVNKDTTEYNAGSYKTPPNSMVEDMLKKLPGVSVGSDGTVKAQGQDVKKILVDGKEFFGDDPKMATKNLTSEMIESVQVFDDKSDQAKFTQIDDGSRSKTINLKLKKGFKKGLFGKSELGYGDQDRYLADASINKFNGDQRLSFMFNSNNINRSGFSPGIGMQSFRVGGMGAMITAMGGMGGSGGGGAGLNRSLNTGLNYSDQWGPKISLTGSYTFSNADSRQQQNILRRTIYSDSTATLDRTSLSGNNNRNHQFNLMFNYMIDSSNSILYRPSLNIRHSDNTGNDTSFSRTSMPLAEYLAVTSRTGNSSVTDGFNLSNSLLFRHRFEKTGRTMTLQWMNATNDNKTNGSIYSSNQFFNPDGSPYDSFIQDQQTRQKTASHNNSLTASYTEPLGTGKILEFNYSYNNNKSTSYRQAYNFDAASGKYEEPDLLLTNDFTNRFTGHRLGTNYQVNSKKYMYQFGLGAERSSLRNQSYQAINKKDSLSRASYTNFFPSLTFTLLPEKGKYLSLRYDGRTNQPNVSQLQNVPDATDTLNIRIGNPNLKQEFNHSMNINYSSTNMSTFKFLTTSITFSAVQNKIVNNISVKGPVQTTTYENMNGYYMGNSFFTYSFPVKGGILQSGSAINISNSLSYIHDVSLLSSVKNFTKTAMVSQGADLNLSTLKYDLGFRVNLTYNDVRYTINKSLNEDYWAQNYSGNLKYNLPKDFVLSTDLNYLITTGRANGYNQRIPIWNASIIKRLFTKKNGEIRLSVNDILNRNQRITRIASDNYVQDTRSNVLRRFFMLSFFFNLNKMG